METRIQEAIDKIRPMLQADGGDVRLVSVDEVAGKVVVALQGACHGCPHAAMTLKNGIEAIIKKEVPEVTEVVAEAM